jgi:soluble lytic murein transglycosylase-like protein
VIRGLDGVLQRIQELERALGQAQPGQQPAQAGQDGTAFAAELNRAMSTQGGQSAVDRPGSAYDGLIRAASQRYGVDEKLVRSVIRAESDFNPRCVSRAGAMGLMQLMPENCREYGVRDAFDPGQNIDGGVRQLKQMIDKFGTLDLALAAYNAGPGAVQRYGGIPPYRETQAYVRKVLGWFNEE